MTESTNDDDAHRPLTTEERKALRELIRSKDAILEVSANFKHLDWALQLLLKISKWTAAVAGLVVVWNSYKSGHWK